MNTYPHDLHRLSHFGLRGHEYHQRVMRNQRLMERAGAVLVFLFLMFGLVASCAPLTANAYEPSNAADVKGRFTLVIGSTVKQPLSMFCGAFSNPIVCTSLAQQPLTVVPGFSSYHLCRAAGMEMQARFNTDGYTLDFVCLLQGK